MIQVLFKKNNLVSMQIFDVKFDVTILGSIVVSIPACHAGDRGSIPRQGGLSFLLYFFLFPENVVTKPTE